MMKLSPLGAAGVAVAVLLAVAVVVSVVTGSAWPLIVVGLGTVVFGLVVVDERISRR